MGSEPIIRRLHTVFGDQLRVRFVMGGLVEDFDDFDDRIEDAPDANDPPAAGRYHRYVSRACPWAHRTALTRRQRGREDVVLPAFDPEHPDAGDAPALRRRPRDADGVILGTPMYHGSYASVLKTALEYSGFDEFEATTVGLLVVAGGGFPTPAMEHLRSVSRDGWRRRARRGVLRPHPER